MQETFFYVPKGTKVLHYFWRGGPHKVLGPDRKMLRDIQVSDDIVSVAVPPQFAGRVWSLSVPPRPPLVLQRAELSCRIAERLDAAEGAGQERPADASATLMPMCQVA